MARKPTQKPAEGKKPRKGKKTAGVALVKPDAVEAAACAPEQAPEPAPRKMGRPTKYDPAMCEQVIELGRMGKSLTQMAAKLGILRETMMEWTKVHADFSDAIKVAQQLSQAWWEDQGQVALAMGKDFNATAFIFQVKNRFKSDYSDKIEVKHDATAAFGKIWQMIGTGKTEGTVP